MQPLVITAATLLIIASVGALVNFRFLFYPIFPGINPVAKARRLSLRGNTLFISDLHLQSDRPFEYSGELRTFVEGNHVSNLVINGDLFDSPKDAERILQSSNPNVSLLQMFGLQGLSLTSYWVKGSPRHDPETSQIQVHGFESLGRCAIINLGRITVIAYHGHDMSLIGALGHAWDRFVSRLSLERLWKRFAKIHKDVWTIFGHTHIPGVDETDRVANCGGWQVKPFVRPTRTGILVTEADDPKSVRIA